MSGLRIRGHARLARRILKAPNHPEAYWSGWLDGRYGDPEQFTNHRLAKWASASDRIDYYRGQRAGREARLSKVRLVEAS